MGQAWGHPLTTFILGLKRRTWCHIAAAITAICFVAPVAFMASDRTEPIVIHKTEIFPPIVRPGQVVKLTWTATELRGCDGTIHRRFIDSQGVIYQVESVRSIYRQLLAGGRKTFSREVQIPSGMPDGPATFTGVREYYCNPFHRYIWPIRAATPPATFTVKK